MGMGVNLSPMNMNNSPVAASPPEVLDCHQLPGRVKPQGRAFSATVNFSVNKKIVFKKQGNMGMQALRYIMLLILSGALSALSVRYLVTKMNWMLLPTKLLVETILFFFNYYMQNKFVFGKGK